MGERSLLLVWSVSGSRSAWGALLESNGVPSQLEAHYLYLPCYRTLQCAGNKSDLKSSVAFLSLTRDEFFRKLWIVVAQAGWDLELKEALS